MDFKKRLEDYTETEFLLLLNELFENPKKLRGDDFEKRSFGKVDHFEIITEHPGKSDVIFYPREGVEDSPEGILNEIKEWRVLNGKPGFKAP
jgi:Colicin immunity protein / pyocin immunity protein